MAASRFSSLSLLALSFVVGLSACSSASRSGSSPSGAPGTVGEVDDGNGAMNGSGVPPLSETPASEPSTDVPGASGSEEGGPGDISLDMPGTMPPVATSEMPAMPEMPTEPSEVIWPNPESFTNSDRWLTENHDRITRLEPRVLVINFDPTENLDSAREFSQRVAGAFAEGSRYHGYSNLEAPVFLSYQIIDVVDLPNDATRAGNGFGFNEFMHSAEFAQKVGFTHPETGAILDMCQLFEQGFVNEIWVAEPPDDAAKLYEFLSRAQVYDASLEKVAGRFDDCAGNGCIPRGQVDCGVSVRLGELNLSRGPGCATHAHGHGLEGQIRRGIVPYLTANASRFFNFGLDDRYGTPFADFYRCSYDDTPCIQYPEPEHLVNGPGLPAFDIQGFGDGCGNVHFAPHSRFHYDYEGQSAGVTARASCEHYGLGDGEGGADQTTLISYDTYQAYNQNRAYSDCGGGWSIYMRQSFPGYQNAARDVDGQPMKNWWPFLYY